MNSNANLGSSRALSASARVRSRPFASLHVWTLKALNSKPLLLLTLLAISIISKILKKFHVSPYPDDLKMNTSPAISQEIEQWTETGEIHGQEFPVCYKIQVYY